MAGGETKAEVSAWTVDSAMAHLLTLMDERDIRYQQRFDASQQALTAALTAQEKAVAAALGAAERAVLKAEMAAEKRFESVNEFRGQLADQATRLLPRNEADVELTAVREAIKRNADSVVALATRIERAEGSRSGLKDGWGYLVGAVGFASTIVAIIYALSR